MKNTNSNTLILGLGDHPVSGKSMGFYAIQHLRTLSFPGTVELMDSCSEGFDLVHTLSGQTCVIIIDSAATDTPPGTILRLTPEDFIDQQDDELTLHHIDIPQTLAITHLMGHAPRCVVVFGIVTDESNDGQVAPDVLSELGELVSQEIKKL